MSTFQRYGNDKVVIDLSSYIYLRYRTGNKFDGLIFDATDTGGHAVYLRSSAHYTKFNNCVFYNAPCGWNIRLRRVRLHDRNPGGQ